MEKLQLFKNKPEVFRCQFSIDGAEPQDTVVRLCLEFEDNKNLFFYGKIKEDGTCEINIPSLKDVNHKEGKVVIEAIADSTYFKVYENEVDIKNSVNIQLSKMESSQQPENKTKKADASIHMKEFEIQETDAKATYNPFIVAKKIEDKTSNSPDFFKFLQDQDK